MSRIAATWASLPSDAVFEKVKPGLQAQLPLRHLQWKAASSQRSTGRQIDAVELDLEPFRPSSTPAQAQPGALSGLTDRPYLHLLFVACEDNELYRATIRQQIREYLDRVADLRNQEWLIVNVFSPALASLSGAPAAAATTSSSKFYQRKGAVIDKMRADFNVGKRDRCLALVLPDDAASTDPATWMDLLGKVKESIVATFDHSVTAYEEDIRKLDAQRSSPGWNFCTFFVQKEGLALTFESMNLLEDALVQYDELEASFYLSMSESSTAWFGKAGGVDAGDDAVSIFASPPPKPYRDLIRGNSITIFDFRGYLLARQAVLLGRLGKVTEFARRACAFVSSVGQLLRSQTRLLAPTYIESWTYGAAFDCVEQCEGCLRQLGLEASQVAGYLALKGSLLDLARKQLDKLGIRAGHIPARPPFDGSLEERVQLELEFGDEDDSPVAEKRSASRRDIVHAIADRAKFDALYANTVRRAIEAFMTCGRKRSALRLHACLAALDQSRGKTDVAQRMYSQLPGHYVDGRWTRIEASLLEPCIELQTELKLTNDRLLSTLSLLRAGVEADAKAWSLDGVDPAQLISDVAALSKALDKDFAAIAFPTFAIDVKDEHGAAPENEDGAVVDVHITNHLPCDVAVDEVRLKLSGRQPEHVWFISTPVVLQPGSNVVSVQCSVRELVPNR